MSLGEKEVLAVAQLAALGIDPARLPAVLANLQRIAQLAQPVNDVELGPEDELGPAWRP